ncbi:hypothetical protein ABYF34_05845 [Buchananella felis]|uniref:hypothetical protein n=1 Tax=Buchananella felis TaxID=3231492 RepID=UPI003529ACD9
MLVGPLSGVVVFTLGMGSGAGTWSVWIEQAAKVRGMGARVARRSRGATHLCAIEHAEAWVLVWLACMVSCLHRRPAIAVGD